MKQRNKVDEFEKKGKTMRKMTIVAVALVAALSARATGFDELTLRTNDWFDVSMTDVAVGTDINQGDTTGTTPGDGSWTAVPENGTATNATDNTFNFIALSSDLDDQLTFTPAPFAVTSGYETVVATIKADAGDELPDFSSDTPQAAFTVIVTNSMLQAYGMTLDGWTNVSYTAASTAYSNLSALTNAWFTLYMDFANGEGLTRYVRYSVQPQGQSAATILTDEAGASWFPTHYSPTINTISFGGVGKVQTFSGDELTGVVTFGDVTISYFANYASATTVVAHVEGTVTAGTTFSMNLGGDNYTGEYNNNTVTFYNVGSGLQIGDLLSYAISASAGNGTITNGTKSVSGSVVGDPTDNWIWENESHNGTTTGSGDWSTNSVKIAEGLTYTDDAAALNNHLFTPTNAVSDAIVTVESQVCFGDVADTSVEAGNDSYAAIRLADDSGKTFQIWAKETNEAQPSWISVSNGNAVDPTITTTVKSEFDFVKGTCKFYADGTVLTNASGTASFNLANGVRTMKAINFNGVGTLTQLRGSYVAAGYSEEVGTGTNVTVSSKWVADNLSNKTVKEARDLLAPNSTTKTSHGNSKYNYFECYALGIDPNVETEAPIITATPDGAGKFGMKLEGINVPEGVTLTVTLQGSSNPSSGFSDLGKEKMTAVGSSEGTTTSGSITFDPANDMDGNVKYLKMDVSIGASE